MDLPGPFGESPVVEKGNSSGGGGRGSGAWAGGRVAEVTAGGVVREGMGLAKRHPREHRWTESDLFFSKSQRRDPSAEGLGI